MQSIKFNQKRALATWDRITNVLLGYYVFIHYPYCLTGRKTLTMHWKTIYLECSFT